MANSFTFSKNYPSNSIVNPNTDSYDYLDAQSPFSFFDFLKYSNSNVNATQMNDAYIEYLKQWNVKKDSEQKITDTIRIRYVDLLKEITLKYTTRDEKRFLSNIDFDDPSDLDIVLPFYSKKINEICNFYLEKRDKLKFKLEKNKIKGTSTSLEKAVYETITDVIFADVLDVGLYQKSVDYNELLKDLNIEIEELYDLYTNYFDNDPKESYETYDVKTELRKSLYSSNINKIDANIFINIDKAIANQIFEDVKVFLTEFGKQFTINYNISDVNLNCKPDDKLFNLVNSTKPKATRLVELRTNLIKKYIGSDFHYITTGSTITDVTSGVLFEAENPSGNLLNRHFPTTATIEEETDLQSCRRIGLFFTPEKNSILYFSTPEKRYKIDESKLEPNKLYIFPDPELYGNTSSLTRVYDSEYPLIHIADYTKSVKNYSNFAVEGDINSTPYTQDFYAYFSKSQTSDKKTGKDGLVSNFSSIYNKGVVTQWATDIFGNQFSLFKDKVRKNLIDKTINVELTSKICEYYDGGPITFYENGILPEVVLVGNPSWVKPNIWASDYYYNLLIEGGVGWSGSLINDKNKLMERGMYWEGYSVDGLVIDRNKLEGQTFDISLNETKPMEFVNVDGSTFGEILIDNINLDEGINIETTYNIDGLYYDRTPSNIYPKPSKILDGNPSDNKNSFQPDFNNGYVLSSIKYKEFDAGTFSDACEGLYDFETQTDHIINQISLSSLSLSSDIDDRNDINHFQLKHNYGSLMVKDVITGIIMPLTASLYDQLESKYTSFKSELYDKVVDFNLYNNFIWIRTVNYLVFEKLSYSDGKYVYSGTTENYLKYTNSSNTENISNPFIFENRSYCLVAKLSVVDEQSNSFYLKPTFYKVSYDSCNITEIINNEPLSSYKNDAAINQIKIRKVNKPTLIYNSRNRKYAFICTVEDINEMAYIYRILFDYDGSKIYNQEIKFYAYLGGQKITTANFHDNPSFNGLLSNNTTNVTFNESKGEMILG